MKKVEMVYFEYFNEPLEDYKVFQEHAKISKQAYTLIGIFILLSVYFALELFSVVDTNAFDLMFYLVATVLTLVIPLIYILAQKRRYIVFADRALIKCSGLKKAFMMPFESIKQVQTDHEDTLVLVANNKKKMTLIMSEYEAPFDKLRDVLNFMGFFGTEAKSFTIDFTDNDIIVEEEKAVMDEDTSQLFEKFIKKYKFLTPGFLEDLIFYNIQIDKVSLTQAKHIIFHLSHLDVKPNHPENPSFKAQKTDEAMVIFENVSELSVHSLNDKGRKDELIGTDVQAVRDTAKGSIIFEASFDPDKDDKLIEFIMSHTAQKQLVRFRFSEIIAGWNGFTGDSWFEKQ